MRVKHLGGALLLIAILAAFAVTPAAAYSRNVSSGDTLFVYEHDVNLTELRVNDDLVISLRKYVDDDPENALVNDIPVTDDESFDVLESLVGDYTGVYYAANSTYVNKSSYVIIKYPTLTLDVVLSSDITESINGK
ncbi:MAG: DUF3821 domain-containing protein, partial [Methanoculleaceae archaeon]